MNARQGYQDQSLSKFEILNNKLVDERQHNQQIYNDMAEQEARIENLKEQYEVLTLASRTTTSYRHKQRLQAQARLKQEELEKATDVLS